jgi:hypothetical protein
MNPYYAKHSGKSNLASAKARLNIHALWLHFGFDGKSKTSCRCPWRDDHKPSFSVNAEGTLWHDYATGEGGDQVDFFQRASGLSPKAACLKFIELAGGHCPPVPRLARPSARTVEAKPKPTFPPMRKGTAADFRQLSRLRKISIGGLEWAGQRGLLWFATLRGWPAWIVTDSARLNAQARRMDGRNWEHIGAKAWTLPGSWASWPIGIQETRSFPAIALCEGGPDFLAAHELALREQAAQDNKREVQCSPVAMLGASQWIHPNALPMFTGKRVRIFRHDDEPGRIGAERWTRQLTSIGTEVDIFTFTGLRQFDGKPVKDLNDSLLMDAASFALWKRRLQ